MNRTDRLALCAFAIIVLGGVAHGLANHRWIPNTAIATAVSRMSTIPATIGPWTSEEMELSNAELTIGSISGYVKRVYTNSQTGAEVVMLLVTGEPGPISLHPPTVCFSGRGFHVVGAEFGFATAMATAESNAQKHVFRCADFSNPAEADPSLIRVCWGWTADGCWQSPDHPRVAFAGESALYKLYVSERWVPVPGVTDDTGTVELFLEAALPEISKALNSSVTSNDTEGSRHDAE